MSYYKVVIFSNFYSRKSIKNRKKTRLENLVLIIIPAAGVEPARCCHRWILSPVRLPIPPCWHSYILTHEYLFVNFTL